MGSLDDDSPDRDSRPARYVGATLRSAGVVTCIIALVLAARGDNAALAPFLIGAALGGTLLAAWERFTVLLFTPDAARKKSGSRRWAIVIFALIKYPLVALLIWWATRNWTQIQLMWFVGGFILIQAVIVMRALGRSLRESQRAQKSNDSDSWFPRQRF